MWVPRSTTRTARRRAGDTPTCGCPILFAYFLRKTTAPESRFFRDVILSEERSDESKDPFRCDETHMAVPSFVRFTANQATLSGAFGFRINHDPRRVAGWGLSSRPPTMSDPVGPARVRLPISNNLNAGAPFYDARSAA